MQSNGNLSMKAVLPIVPTGEGEGAGRECGTSLLCIRSRLKSLSSVTSWASLCCTPSLALSVLFYECPLFSVGKN